MKKLLFIALILASQAIAAQPLVLLGVPRPIVVEYMDNQPGYTRITPKVKTFATYVSTIDTITYQFVRNDLGFAYTCIQVTLIPHDIDSYIASKLQTYRFILEPYGYSLYTGYANDDTVRILRHGNTLVYKY